MRGGSLDEAWTDLDDERLEGPVKLRVELGHRPCSVQGDAADGDTGFVRNLGAGNAAREGRRDLQRERKAGAQGGSDFRETGETWRVVAPSSLSIAVSHDSSESDSSSTPFSW